MSASPTTRRATAEIDFGEGQAAPFKIGNRSIHQFWHLFVAHFRHVLLAPQRRPDSGRVAWTWREAIEKPPVTATELAEVRRRLTEANRSLAGGFGGLGRNDDVPGGGATLEGQVRGNVREMVAQLIAQRDLALSAFVCRTDAGLMLHSWGASVAAQPYYPDAQHGEISGTLFVGQERPAGVAVVLENAQGLNVARVKSDKEGAFRFSGVVPGGYRVRVADRSDFPGGGIAVTLEREAITGLELRSASTEPISVAAILPPQLEPPNPWYKRRLTAVVVLLLILGIGGCVWRSTRSQTGTIAEKPQSSGWQSAKGKLEANGDSKNSTVDDRKVGEEGAFSTLSKTLPPPKLLTPRHASAASDTKGSAPDRAITQPDDSPDSFKPAAEDKNAKPDSADKSAPRAALPAQTNPPESRTALPANPGDATHSTEDSPGANPDGDDPKSAENKLAKSSRGAAGKKRPAVSGKSSSAVDDSPDETASSSAPQTTDDPAASATAAAKGSKSPKAAAKSPAATGKNSDSPAAESSADTGAPDSPAAGASAPVPGQLAPAAGRKSKEAAKGAPSNGPAGAPAESAGTDVARNSPEESPAADSAADKSAPQSARPKKTPAGQVPPQAKAAEAPGQENSGETAAPAVPAPARKIARQPPAAAGKSSSPAKQTNNSPPSPAGADAASQAPAPPSAVAESAAPVARPKPSKKPVSSSAAPAVDEKQAAESSVDSPSAALGSSAVAPAAEDEGLLIQIGRIQASAWKSRLIRDVIVPTRPVTAAEEERLETLRTKLLQERTARMPAAFQQPQMRSGFALEFPSEVRGKKTQPHWQNDNGVEPAGSTVHGQHAELGWIGPAPAPNTNYTLRYPDGRTIARVSIDQTGAPTLKMAMDVRAWYWIGIERGPARANESSPDKTENGFDWRLLSGAPVPASWARDDRWLEGRGQRIDIPLDATTRRVGNYQIALVDPTTGWAIVGDVAAKAP